ncbi:MAG: galactokinase [Thaumarchaeota archaeon]|nr:galactokinase [Nitrososphaerota archaeon]
MIITRSPLRVTLGGGGTDLPSYYHEHGGFILSAAINKYVYVAVNESFRTKISLKYSQLEDVDFVEQVQHPVIREALKMTGVTTSIDITSIADIPAGTGLGSSGSFTCALLKALYTLDGVTLTAQDLAERAFKIEAEILRQPVGKQDQYIAAVGGITSFIIDVNGKVDVKSLVMPTEAQTDLEENLLLFFTGYSRLASEVLRNQDVKSLQNDREMIRHLDGTKNLGFAIEEMLKHGRLRDFAYAMHVHWSNKRQQLGMSNSYIDDLYKIGLKNGALGGKLVGAGGGGFLMFYTEDAEKLRAAMSKIKLREVHFKFDFEGTKVLVNP